jgi:hypothetical protein
MGFHLMNIAEYCEDPNKPGLFAGTERGVYVSLTMEILGKN